MADGTITIDIIMDDGSVKKGLASINGLEGATNKAGTSIKSMVAAMGLVKIASAAFDVLKSSVGSAVSRFDTLNNSTRVFSNMGFTAKETTDAMDDLKKSIQGLPTPLDSAVKGVQLIASSTGDLGKSQKIFEALNNGILGFGGTTEQVDNAVIQLSQSFSNGKVDAETWNSMINSGLGPALNALAKTMGKTTGELKAGLSDGSISVKDFQDGLIKLNNEGGGGLKSLKQIAQDAMSGIGTGVANMKTAVVRGLANVIGKVDELVKVLTGKSIGQNITEISKVIDSAFTSINNSIGGSIGFFTSLKTNVTKVFGDIQKAIAGSSIGEALNILKSDFSDFIKSFNFNGLSGAFNSIGTTISTLFKSIDFSGLAASFGAALIGLQQPLIQYGSTLANYWKTIFAKLGPIVSSTLGTVLTQIPALFQALVSAVAPIITQISSMISKLDFSGIQAVLQAIIPAVVSGFQTMMAIVGPSIQQVITSFGNLWNAIQPLLTVLAGALMPAFQVIGSFLGGVFKGILDGVSFAFDAIKVVVEILTPVISFLVDVFKACAPALSTVGQWVGYVIGMFSSLGGSGGSLKSILSSAWDGIKSAISVAGNVIGSVINVIKAVFSAVGAAGGGLKGVLSAAWSGIQSAISVAGGVISGIINTIKGVFSALSGAGNSLKGGISSAWSAITGAISKASGTIGGIIDNIKGFFTGLTNIDISGAGTAIMNGFLGGLKGAYENVKDFIGGIGNWIKEHKGPISYDRKLLIPAGNSIMDGLNEGLGDSFKNVQRNVSGMADKLASGFNLNLPKVTAEYAVSSAGLNAGEQLAVSQLNSIRSNIQRQLDNQPSQSESSNIVSQALSAVKSLGEHETVLVVNDRELARVMAKANQEAQNNLNKTQNLLRGRTT
ncbi:tape measure protein [Lactococcus lactis]|uniref:tape measure protein n=1 Tax=Lactococcus lactis TaxID=1358 RepID=UPI0024186DA5|nr:tape measure protein [Lactococcus lactis]MDG4963005.1 tape measure protein [Lactococcus lactis]